MDTVTPYIIQDIYLDKLHVGQLFEADPELQYYCCFWWKEIPVGHLFIERREKGDADVLQQRIWEAIFPAICFYASGKVDIDAHVKRPFLEKNYRLFNCRMRPLLLPHAYDAACKGPGISVIICTRGRSKDLQRCLHALQRQVTLPDEIVVVDNAPVDDSTFNVTKQFPNAIYCKEVRAGLSIARNTGIRQAVSPVLAFTDDDVIPHPLWLYHIKKSFCSPSVAALTGLVIASSLTTKSQQLFEKNWSFNGGYQDKVYDGVYFNRQLRTGPRVWNIGAGANMAFRKSALSITGLFDERLGAGASGCSEDSEIWYRMLSKGLVIHYNPRAAVFHEHRKELPALYAQIFNYMKGHAAAALIQQSQVREAGYRKYLGRKILKGYIPLLIKNLFQPFDRKMILLQIRGLIAGIFFFIRNKNKSSNTKT